MIQIDNQATDDKTLHLPRILCLHGGGTNARIFHAQCRVVEAQLKSRFRLCYAEAPFPSVAGPDVLSVYKDWGPFKSWFRWLPDQPEVVSQATVEAIDASLYAAMDADDSKGATGQWVALLGFSQGAKMCTSLAFRQQVQAESLGRCRLWMGDYRFAVLLSGRGPIISLQGDHVWAGGQEYLLRLPTIHVHGTRDPGLEMHRELLERYCERDSASIVQLDIDHRVPIKSKEVSRLVAEICALAEQTGIL